jgi:hypothetical protein
MYKLSAYLPIIDSKKNHDKPHFTNLVIDECLSIGYIALRLFYFFLASLLSVRQKLCKFEYKNNIKSEKSLYLPTHRTLLQMGYRLRIC